MLCHTTSLCAVSSAWNILPIHLLGKLLPTLEAPVQMPHPLWSLSYSLYLYKIYCFFLSVAIMSMFTGFSWQEYCSVLPFPLPGVGWCFQIVVLEKTLDSPLDSKEINQSILKEINPEYSWERLMLKLQYLGHLMWKANSLEKILMLGKIEGRRRRGRQKTSWLDGITNAKDVNLGKLQEMVRVREAWCATVYGVTKSQTEATMMSSRFISVSCHRISFFLMLSNILLYVYITFKKSIPLSTFINRHWSCFHTWADKHPKERLLDHMIDFFLRNCHTPLHSGHIHNIQRGPFSSHPHYTCLLLFLS